MGLLTSKETPVIWRGPMATRLIQQFLSGVAWGELDYLVIDLPPGTGDVQLTLTQSVPLTGAVIVTTPQDVARTIAEKGLRMFQPVQVPVLGVIENMSYFVCSHCQEKTFIFRQGGGKQISDELGIPFLGGDSHRPRSGPGRRRRSADRGEEPLVARLRCVPGDRVEGRERRRPGELRERLRKASERDDRARRGSSASSGTTARSRPTPTTSSGTTAPALSAWTSGRASAGA